MDLPPPDQGDAHSRATPPLAIALKNMAWLLLVLAILERYVLKLGSSATQVTVVTVVLLLLALTLRVAAWISVKRARNQPAAGRR
jgi:hypothetical protein